MDSWSPVMPPRSHLLAVLAIVMIALLSRQVGQVDACSCLPAHPQSMYCRAGWAIKAKVKTDRLIPTPGMHGDPMYPEHTPKERVYGVKISKVFKQGTHGFTQGAFVKLSTADNGGLCGAHLNTNTTYYIQGYSDGDKPRFGLCDNAQVWTRIPPVVQMGYRYLYKKNCQCTIGDTSFPEPGGSDCTMDGDWDVKQCYKEHAACVPSRAANEISPFSSTRTACKWSRRGVFYRCMRNARSKDDDSPFEWEP